ncbi:MAG: hypothetical protein J0L76_16670 [Rhodobacterales bacterium]|nr:hypothetical protein [Rhodobacterales bacterium]
MDSERAIVLSAIRRAISLREAEWRLRGSLGSGTTDSDFQQVYNYLDEIVGAIEGRDETPDDHIDFIAFLKRIGFSDLASGYDSKSA